MSNAPTPVDVLIVHYLRPDLTQRAIAAIAGPGAAINVWDNSGDIPPLAGVNIHGNGQNLYFAGGNNALFGLTQGDYVLLLNPDMELTHQSLVRMGAFLRDHPRHWGITLRFIGPDGHDQNYLHALPTVAGLMADRLPPLRGVFRPEFRRYRCLDVDLRASGVVEQPPAAALLMRRADIDAVGGLFDEDYPLFFNDVDLARRMRQLGTCAYLGDLTALHEGGASLRAAGRQRVPVGEMYDEALLRYARRNLRHSWLIHLAVVIRHTAERLRGGWWQ